MTKLDRVIVTGGAGFIGSALVRKLVSDGHDVLTLDKLTYAGDKRALGDALDAGNHRFVQADIADPDAVKRVFAEFEPDAVFHLAAESHVDRSIDGPAEFIHTNLVGSFVMLEAALEQWSRAGKPDDFRFVHVSTDEVYGELGDEGAFSEDTPYAPNSPYSATKAGADHLARAWRQTYGLPVVITNCSNNYGPYQNAEKLLPTLIRKAVTDQPLPIYGKGENVRDWLYVDDHVTGLIAAAKSGRLGEKYNIGGNAEAQNIQIARTVCALLDKLAPRDDGKPYADQITFVEDRPGHDFRYAIDASKISSELGWGPQETIDTGLEKTIAWYLDNQWWWADHIKDGDRIGLTRAG